MADATGELHKAVYSALSSNASLTSLAPIYDLVPQDTPLPYIDLGEIQSIDEGGKTFEGEEHFITIHIWSSKQSRAELYAIVNQIDTTLHHAALSVSGHNLIRISRRDKRFMMDADGKTQHGIIQFQALTQQGG